MSSLSPSPHASKAAVLDAALRVNRTRGYTATTLDDLCAAAGVSKGSFFHHFPGKEDMTLAAIAHRNHVTGGSSRTQRSGRRRTRATAS